MMKAGKEEGKNITEPLFPRLHVNDREKGGPRAPPRNKMALYEQFSIPSQRFNSSSTSRGPISSHKASASSSQGYLQEISVFAPSDVPAQPFIHLAKRVCFRSSDSTGANSRRAESAGTSKRQSNNGISIANGSAGNSLQLYGASNANQSHQKNFDDGDDFMVPTFVHSRTSPVSNKHLSAIESERITTSHVGNPQKNSSSLSPNFSCKSLKGTFTNNVRLRNIEQKYIEQRQTVLSINKDSKRIPDCGRRSANYVMTSLNQDDTGTATVAGASGHDNAEVHQKYPCIGAVDGDRCIGTDFGSKGDNSRVWKESCSEASCRNNQAALNEADKFNQESESWANGSPELEDVYKNEIFDASFPDSISGMVTCPDDVIGVIGPKHFWKARKHIVNQQRIFAIQVFELHRLIKVQKLLAASPDVLKVDVYFSQSSIKVPTKVTPPENFKKSHQPTVAVDASSQKPNESKECPEANTMKDPPASQTPKGGLSPFPSAPDNRLNPWCMHPHQNQWLVPVMYPSEGLVHKPYPGPCAPTTSFMAPFYGGYAPPLSFPPVSVDFMNPACGALLYPQQPPIYFPSPYGIPVMKQIMPSSTVEQVSPLLGSQPDKPQQFQRSCNVSNPRSDATSGHLQKPRASKGSEAHGSTLTIPLENARDRGKDASPLFPASLNPNGTGQPMESADRSSEDGVIRVVPHNARLATESAARIFRFIQQERKKSDL